MKIVIISQTSYPRLSPRAHRTTELAKQFAKFGHEVIVYAYLGDYDYYKLEQDYKIKFKTLGKAKFGVADNLTENRPNILIRLISHYLGDYTQFPFITMIPHVKSAIKKEGNIDLLITIAMPHIIHYASAISDLSKVKKWIADCGDPFMGNPFHKYPSYMESFERKWCKKCDFITVPIEDAINAYYPEFREKIRVIPQGFDFSTTQLSDYHKNEIPTFGYSGVFYKDLRDPSKFLSYLSTLNKPFKFICYTRSTDMLSTFKEALGEKLIINNYVPREQLIKELSTVDFLVNIQNSSGVQQPSKLIDYALTKRPILNITSEFSNSEKTVVDEFLDYNFNHQLKIDNVDRYNIVNVAEQFIHLANE